MGCCSLWHAAWGAPGREQTLTPGSSLPHVPCSSCPLQPHHRARAGAMCFLDGCCHRDTGDILKGFGGAGKGSPDLKHWLCMPAVQFPLRAGSGKGSGQCWQQHPTESRGGSQRGAVTWSKATGTGGQGTIPRAKPLCVCTLVPDLLPGAHLHTPCMHGWCGQWAQHSRSILPMSSHTVDAFFFLVFNPLT